MVKVLVLGDDGVGKSSLICTLISNHFSETEMPDVYTDVSIPENAVWENEVQVTIMDSSQHTSVDELTAKILDADSIVLVHDVERPETLGHLMTRWLPLIVSLTQAPVIVAANKVTSSIKLLRLPRMRSAGRPHEKWSGNLLGGREWQRLGSERVEARAARGGGAEVKRGSLPRGKCCLLTSRGRGGG
jgi:hypothetical protein